MAYKKNVSVLQNNNLSLSGSVVTVTGSMYGSAMSGTTAEFTSLSASSVRINNAYTLPTSDGTTGQVISTNGSGQLTFTDVAAGSTPGGPDTSVQFNSGSTLSGSSNLTYNYATGVLSGTISQFTGVSSSYLVLSGTTEPTQTEGTIFYDNTNNLLRQWTEVTNVDLHLGQQLAVRVKNDSGTTLAKGKVVHLTGSTNSDTPLVTTASYESDSVSADTLGVLMSSLGADEVGYALLYGVLTGIDLSTYGSGDMLYLSSSGDFSNSAPQSPLHEVRIAQVTRATNNGAMFVRIQNGYETDELHDVLFSNKAEGDLISWDATTGVWRNKKQLTGSYEITGDITASNAQFTTIAADTITAREYHTELVSASIIYQSGSTKFGDTPGGAQQDIHQFSGSLYITGSTVTLTGGSFSGNGSGLTNLAADTATILETSRTINGVSFNGSSNITVEPYIEDDESSNSVRNLVFTDNSTAGYKRLNEDSAFVYNPYYNTLAIGTTSPNYGSAGKPRIHLYGSSINSADFFNAKMLIEDNTDVYLQLLSPSTSTAGFLFGDDSNSAIGKITYEHSEDAFYHNIISNSGEHYFQINSDNELTVKDTLVHVQNNLSVAKTTANAPLDVNGNAIVSGSLTVTGTVTELSTKRIKKNIRSMKSQLDTISKLNPVTYYRRDTEEKTKEYGFISEEVKEVYPEFVKNEGVNYSKMVSVLVSAVKELKDKVEEQQKEIEELKKGSSSNKIVTLGS